MEENLRSELVQRIAHELTSIGQKSDNSITEEQISGILDKCLQSVKAADAELVLSLAGQAIDIFNEVVFCALVQETQRHGVELVVETDDAQIKAFLGGSVVFRLGFSATGEGRQHDDKGQCCQNDGVFLHIQWFLLCSINATMSF